MDSIEKIDKWIEALNKSDFDGLGITRMTREAKDMLVRDMEDWKGKIHELDERVAIQSPDVVRCRDCKYAELHKWEGHEAIYCTCHEEQGYDPEPEHPLEWFCADGELKD